jgi:NDP-sugar pyrophosphorylase family protein
VSGFESVLLAAGRARRMMPLTAVLPKVLLPLGGEPILHHLLRRLEKAGASTTRILIDTGPYRLIRDHLAAVPQDWLSGQMAVRFEEVCTLTSPDPMQALASRPVGRLPVLVLHSDELVPAAISGALARLSAKHGSVVTAMVAPGLTRPRLLRVPHVTEVGPGETPPRDFRIVGQAALPVGVLHRLADGELAAATLVELIGLLTRRQEQVLALAWPGPYADVGELWRYEAAVRSLGGADNE